MCKVDFLPRRRAEQLHGVVARGQQYGTAHIDQVVVERADALHVVDVALGQSGYAIDVSPVVKAAEERGVDAGEETGAPALAMESAT